MESTTQFKAVSIPKLSIPERMAEWRAANPEERSAMVMEHTLRISNAVAELQEARRHHHEQIEALQITVNKELKPHRKFTIVSGETDIWIKRIWMLGLTVLLLITIIELIYLLNRSL